MFHQLCLGGGWGCVFGCLLFELILGVEVSVMVFVDYAVSGAGFLDFVRSIFERCFCSVLRC